MKTFSLLPMISLKLLLLVVIKEPPELIVSDKKFSQSFVKTTIKNTWQFSDETTTSQEENMAEVSVFFKIAGASDVWFISQNIKASGIKNDLIQEKLLIVQSACDSIEKNLNQLKFSAVQGKQSATFKVQPMILNQQSVR